MLIIMWFPTTLYVAHSSMHNRQQSIKNKHSQSLLQLLHAIAVTKDYETKIFDAKSICIIIFISIIISETSRMSSS